MTPAQEHLKSKLTRLRLVGAEVTKAFETAINGLAVADSMISEIEQEYGLLDDGGDGDG